jgi:hypothetical protein
MKKIRRKLPLRVGAGRLLVGAAALLVAGSAYAQSTWPTTQQQRRWAPQPIVEPEGPVFSWDPLRFGVAAETRTTWLQDSGARRLAGKGAPTGVGLSLHYDAWRPSARMVAKVDLGWAFTSSSSWQTISMATETLDTNLLSLGISTRYHIFRWLAPYARLAGGVGWDKLSVGRTTGQLHDERRFGHGSVGGGVFLRSPGLQVRSSPPSFTLALMGNIEAGYMLATSSTFNLQSSPGSGTDNPIPTQPVAIGQVSHNAPYLRVSFGLAF